MRADQVVLLTCEGEVGRIAAGYLAARQSIMPAMPHITPLQRMSCAASPCRRPLGA